MFLPKFVLKGNLQARSQDPPGVQGVTCAPRGAHTCAQGQSCHMHVSHVFYATRVSSILRLKAPGAPENEGPALVTHLVNQIQSQRKPAPCFTANRSLRFSCTVFAIDGGPSRQTHQRRQDLPPKRSRFRPTSCTGGRAPPPEGCAPPRTGTGSWGQHLHPSSNRDELVQPTSCGSPGDEGRLKSGVCPQTLKGPTRMLACVRLVRAGHGTWLLPAAAGSAGAPRGSSRRWSPRRRPLRAPRPLRRPRRHRAGC